jgi:hypothetical protein
MAAARASAQYVTQQGAHFYHVSIGLGGGATIPTGNSPTPLKTGYNGQAYMLIHLLKGLPAIRFNVGYSRSEYDQPSGLSGGASVPGYFGKKQEVLSGIGGLNLNLFHLGPVTPYLTAGLGAFDVRTTVDTAQSESGGTTTTSGKIQSKVNFGIDAGGGLAMSFGRVSAFLEGRVQNVYTSGGGLIKSSKHVMAVPVSFGVAVGVF